MFGIKGGLNLSNSNFSNLNLKDISGYQGGIFTRIGAGTYVQPEIFLSSSSGEVQIQNQANAINGSVNIKFSTLNLPLLIGKEFGKPNFNFRIFTGPYYTYNLNPESSLLQQIQAGFNNFGKFNNSAYGLLAGFGIDLGNITTDLRYQATILNPNTNFGQKARMFTLNLGLKIF